MLCCLFTYSEVHHILCCVVYLRIVNKPPHIVDLIRCNKQHHNIVLCYVMFTYSEVHHILCCVVYLRIVMSTTYCVVLFVYV